jgi:PEP-CTERM motif
MKKFFAVAVTMLLVAGSASAAPELVYTADGTNTTVTAQEVGDPSTQYWQMSVNTDTTSSRGGCIWSFEDLSGASNSGFGSYAHRRIPGDPGLFFNTGAVYTLDGQVTGLGSIVQNASVMTYIATKTVTQAVTLGVATYTSAFTINAPVVTASGYDTNITIAETYAFNADWVGDGGDGRARLNVRLHASISEDEWTGSTYNGYEDTPQKKYQTASATVTGNDPLMAEGSTFTLTSTWPGEALSYSDVSTTYGSAGLVPYFLLHTDMGITGNLNGSAGPAGSERTFTSTTELDISIVPEPATMGLLGLGLIGMVVRRNKK